MKTIFKLFILFSLFNACKEQETIPTIETPIDPNSPVAIVGEDQFINVGSYIALDGSKSIIGNGDRLIFKWSQDSANPEQITLCDCKYLYRASIKEGTYKYSLVINNGIKDSNPAQLVVKVSSRLSSVIKDTVLEANIRYAIKKQSGDLTDSDFLSVTNMLTTGYVISPNKIKNLDGIERCQNLKVLDLTLQSVTNLTPLSNLNNLEELEVDQNWELSDVTPLSNLTNLKYLNISSDNITNISSLSSLKNLISLKIEGSPQYHLTDLSAIRSMTHLREFTCAFIPNPDLSVFSNLTELEAFYCSYSKISDLSGLKNCTKLWGIFITANEVSDLTPISNLKELQYLWVSGNKIEDVTPLKNLEKLVSLILDNNNITDIKPLVDNVGLGTNTTIILRNNPLNDKSINEYIPQLITRGVNIVR